MNGEIINKSSLQEALEGYRIILNSASPRRKQLMESLCIDFEVKTVSIDERKYTDTLPDIRVENIAKQKALACDIIPQAIFISADTLVEKDKAFLGKPEDMKQASEFLKILSGNQHKVYTGVCLRSVRQIRVFSCYTKVFFAPICSQDRHYYLKGFQVMDKAGAYGIQDWIGTIAAEKIEGSYNNVLGLPTQKLYRNLISFVEKEKKLES